MSKHFSLFQTETQYEAGLTSLDFPNVSLVEQTGNVHYSVAVGPKELWDAAFGDILLCELSSNKLLTINNDYYNLTDFPLASYEPIGVCIFDRSSYQGNKAVFMSLKWMDYTNPTNGKASYKGMYFGGGGLITGVKYPSLIWTENDCNKKIYNYVDTIQLNNTLKQEVTVDYSGATITNSINAGNLPALCCCWRFSPQGTSGGDWYAGTPYDYSMYISNTSTIVNIITNIKNIAGSTIVDTVQHYMLLLATRGDGNSYKRLDPSGPSSGANWNYNLECYLRALYFAGPEEL